MYCRRCGAALHQGVVICPECGARQSRGISSVRCARCGHRVSLGLTVCPHCGRDVHPAGPRWGLWLLGFAVLAVAALWGLDELPMEKIGEQVASVRLVAARAVQFLGPAASGRGEATPPAGPTPRATQVIAALPATATSAPTATEPPSPQPTNTAAPTIAVSATLTVTVATAAPATATLSPTLAPTVAPSPTPTSTPTLEPTATPTTPPTATPAPTTTSAPAGRVTYKVKSGDTLSSIAAKFGISWQDLASANKLTSRSTLQVGQELIIPGQAGASVPPTAAPAATAKPAAAATKYKVQSGDSLYSIAAKFGITWQELAAANGLTSSSRLRIGQELIVPGKGGVSVVAPTAAAPATAVAPAPTATAAAVVLLAAPQLLGPGDQASYRGQDAMIELSWGEVQGKPADAAYRVTIEWIQDGVPRDNRLLTTATVIRFPPWLFEQADQPTRKYGWSVRVVRMTTDGKGGEKEILLSPSSEARVLYWY